SARRRDREGGGVHSPRGLGENAGRISRARSIIPGGEPCMQRLEPACDGTRTHDLPRGHRRCDAFYVKDTEVSVFKELPSEPACTRGYDHGAWLGQRL